MLIRTAYGPKLKVQLITPEGEGRTKQSFKQECDVNHIMARFQKTGVLDFASRYEAQYGDVSGVNFTAAMQVIADAKTMFNEMPARVRDRFRNDPAKFLDFINNPLNKDEARELGLLKAEEPKPAPPVAAPAPAPAPSGEGGKGA